jgi:hypothetical protein
MAADSVVDVADDDDIVVPDDSIDPKFDKKVECLLLAAIIIEETLVLT